MYDLIKKPLVTEKSSSDRAQNKYYFKVAKYANKTEVKKAIQKLFNVTVTAVNMINVKGKQRSQGRVRGHTQDWKKAVVTVKEGQAIEALAS